MRPALMLLLIAMASLCAVAPPAAALQIAIGSATFEDFEGYALGPKSIDLCPGLVGPGGVGFDCGFGRLQGGSIVAQGGGQSYAGNMIGLAVTDPFNLSWPGLHAQVSSGDSAVTLTMFAYDYDLGSEVVFYTDTLTAGQSLQRMGTGSEAAPAYFTRFRFASQSLFTLDNLEIGLENVGPGIPEPTSWALLIAGFGTVGSVARRRRQLG